jgi:enediyne biosynthesis protein E4
MFTTRQLLFWGLCLLACAACKENSSEVGGSGDVVEIVDPAPITAISFVDVTKKADLYRTHYYPPQNPTSLPCYGHESMVGGAAIGDYNQDGWLDIFVPRLYLKDLLFINKQDGSFDEVGGSAGVDSDAGSSAAAWADIDGDGDLDLIVTMLSKHPTLLYLNQGNGTFKEEGMKRGVTLEVSNAVICPMMTSPSFGDIDQDGDLDLPINAWYDTKLDNANWARVYRNDGNGHFEDVSQELGIEDMGWEAAFSSAFVDINNDSWMDLFLVADWNATALYLNNGDGTFSDESEMAQVGLDDNGMGLAVGDYNNDDRLDFFVTSIGLPPHPMPYCDKFPCSGNKLYRGSPGIQFFDATGNTGVTNGDWGWGAAFFDFDNDGDLDLGMTNGYELLIDNPGFQNTNERL